MLSSSIFYPSNQELRPVVDQGSIKASLGTQSELFNAKPVQSDWHYYGKPVRVFARIVFSITIGTTVAPVGAVFHGGAAIIYSVMWLRSEGDQTTHNWKKVEEHASYFFIDLLTSIIMYWGIVSILYFRDLIEVAPRFLIIGILTNGFLLFSYATAPEKVASYLFLSKAERAAVYKAICLKNCFGIVAQGTNGLLHYNPVEDGEDRQGSLFNLWKCQALEFLLTVEALNEILPPVNKLKPGRLFTDGPNSELENANRSIEEAIAATKIQSEKEALHTLKMKYNMVNKNLSLMYELLERCLIVMHKDPFDIGDPSISLPKFPFTPEYINQFYNQSFKPINRASTWLEYIRRQKIPDQIGFTDSECIEFHRKLKAGKSPLEILGFKTKPDESDLKRRYRELMLKLHPDKNPEYKEVAHALSCCLNEAYRIVTNDNDKAS